MSCLPKAPPVPVIWRLGECGWRFSMINASSPLASLMRRGARSRHFAGTRWVQRSGGKSRWESPEIIWILRGIVSFYLACFASLREIIPVRVGSCSRQDAKIAKKNLSLHARLSSFFMVNTEGFERRAVADGEKSSTLVLRTVLM